MEYLARPTPVFSVTYFGRLVFLFCVYVATAKIGLSLHQGGSSVVLIWPPNAIALTAVLFWGYEMWPAIALGSLLIYLLTGVSIVGSLGMVASTIAEVFLGVYLLKNVVKINPLFKRVQDSIGIIVTSLVISAVGVSLAVISLALGSSVPLRDVFHIWLVWWLADALAMIVIAPFLIRWCWKPRFFRTPQEWLEEVAAFTLLIVASIFAFFDPLVQIAIIPLAYLFTPMLWISLRSSPRGISLANLLTTSIAFASILMGYGPFARADANGNFFVGQLFIGTTAIIFFIFNSSVEERKEVEHSLEAHVGTLEHMVQKISSEDKAKTDFLAILAHELRNPLSPIVSALELIKINGVLPGNEKLFETLDSQIRTMRRLLDDLLDISRITHKKFKIQKETVALQVILNTSLEMVSSFISENDHVLVVSLPEELIWLDGDPIRLTQIFVNLLYNAAKYTGPGGTIELTCRKVKDAVQVVVKDTGIGIEQHMLDRIFEPFVQVSDSSAPAAGVGTGLGIGLSLTRRLVDLHKGTVTVESAGKGKGSTFTVTLPILNTVQLSMELSRLKLHSDTKENKPVHTTERKTLQILVVDDNEAAAVGLQKLLEHSGHDVHSVYNGKDAIEYVHEHHPAVVILDIGMPDMSGYVVAERLRTSESSSLFLIALSGYGQKEDKTRAINAGFNYHLTKPVQISEIEKLLEKRKNN